MGGKISYNFANDIHGFFVSETERFTPFCIVLLVEMNGTLTIKNIQVKPSGTPMVSKILVALDGFP